MTSFRPTVVQSYQVQSYCRSVLPSLRSCHRSVPPSLLPAVVPSSLVPSSGPCVLRPLRPPVLASSGPCVLPSFVPPTRSIKLQFSSGYHLFGPELDLDLGLENKRALVTGSTAGIGLATARMLAAEGAIVTVNGRTERRVSAAVDRIRQQVPGARVEGIAADLSNAAGAETVIRRLSDVDVLVNNMGIFEPVPFEEITDADWMRFFETNVLSAIRLSRQYVSGMRRRDWGRIVFVSSESGLQIPVEMIHYGVTKTAQLAVSRGLAESLAGTGVTVNSVLPGPTVSEGVGGFLESLAAARGVDQAAVEREFFTTARPSSILRRFATVDEVAAMIVYV